MVIYPFDTNLRSRTCLLALLVGSCMSAVALGALTTNYSYSYDGNGHLTQKRVYSEEGTTLSDTRITYDALGRNATEINGTGASAMTTNYVYDCMGNLATQAVKTDGDDFITEYTYDAMGRHVTAKGPTTDFSSSDCPVEIYKYDLNGNLVTRKSLVLSNLIYADTVTEYDALNRSIVVTDPEGCVRKTFYNSRSLPIYELACDQDGNTVLRQTRTEYDAAGRVITQVVMANPNSSAASNVQQDRVTEYDYDDGGRPITKTTYNMLSSTPLETVKEYDGLGRITKTTDPKGFYEILSYDGVSGAVTTQVEYNGSSTRSYAMVYDGLGRLTKRIADGPPSLTTQYEYDGLDRRTKVTNPEGQYSLMTYDLLGRQVTKIDDEGGLARTTRYVYSKQGLIVTQIANDGTSDQMTTYDYGPSGQMTQATYPDSGTLQISYYPNGKDYERIDPANNTLRYYYDDRGLILTKGDPNGDFWLTFTYDGLGRMVTARKGTSADEDAESETIRYYNGLSQVIEESQAISGDTARTVRMEYDQVGNRLRMVYPD